MTFVSKWNSFRPPLFICCINVFWAILDLEPSQMKLWIKLFISSIALLSALTTLETYIIGANTKLLSTVIFPLSDNFHCFHIFSVAFSVKILCWKLYLKLFKFQMLQRYVHVTFFWKNDTQMVVASGYKLCHNEYNFIGK